MQTHKLKTVQPYFNQVVAGLKTFELRNNDRDFKQGDTLLLREFYSMPKLSGGAQYSGREILVEVTYVLHGAQHGLEKCYCIMAIKKTLQPKPKKCPKCSRVLDTIEREYELCYVCVNSKQNA